MAVLRRRLWWVLGNCLAVAALALLFSLLREKEYSATASILVREPGAAETLLGRPGDILPDPDREAATSAGLFRLDVVADRTARRLGVADVANHVTTSTSETSNLLSVTAQDRDPVRAARIANTFAQEFIAFRRDTERALIAVAEKQMVRRLAELGDVERQGQQGQVLREGITTLQTHRSVQTGDAIVVQSADPPSSPSSPKTLSNTALGGAVGLLLGLIAALLRESFDDRVRDPREVEDTLERPILGFVPKTRALRRRRRKRTSFLPPDKADIFRTIRTNLWHANGNAKGRAGSVLVTSPGSMDGKSTIAWNLAAATMAVRRNVLLIEGDLRHPSVASRRGLRSEIGLIDVLMGQVPVNKAIQSVPAWPGQPGAGRHPLELDVLVAGSPVPDSGELLDSAAMANLLEEFEQQYDCVVVDGPSASRIYDAVPLMTIVREILVVVRLGTTEREGIVDLREQIAKVNAHVVGAVITFTDPNRTYYGLDSRRRLSPRSDDSESGTGLLVGRMEGIPAPPG